MEPGDIDTVPGCPEIYYVDTGMYDTAEYGSVYVLDAEQPAVIDTGIGTNREHLFDALENLEITPEYVIPTHVHLDHAGGAGFLSERYPAATVVTHDRGVRHLVDPERLVAGTKAAVDDQWTFYTEPKPVPKERVRGVTDRDTIDLGDKTLRVIEAPGHAPHQIVLYDDEDDAVFTADAAGIYVPALDEIRVTSPPPQFDLQQCHVDVDRLRELDPATLCFAHFGPRPFDDDLLAGYKRTLLEWVETVKTKRQSVDDETAIRELAAEVPERVVNVWGARKARAETRLNARGVLAYLDQNGSS